MAKVYIMRGLPGSGKSTWAFEHCVQNPGTYRLNLDDFRAMLGFGSGSDTWTKEKEKVAVDLLMTSLVQLVRAGSDVVLDNTHVQVQSMNRYKKALNALDVQFELKDFTGVPAEECLRRNALRTGSARVPDSVIRGMAKALQRQQTEVSTEWLNEGRFTVRKYTGTPGAERAVVFDLDGTLFEMSPERTPYQFWAVGKDAIKKPVFEALKAFRGMGYKIILCSGRDGAYRRETLESLTKNAVIFDQLFMRAAGDRRKDNEIKHEIAWERIFPHYDVRAWFDDRQQVVDMVRETGVTCFQVAEGNF